MRNSRQGIARVLQKDTTSPTRRAEMYKLASASTLEVRSLIYLARAPFPLPRRSQMHRLFWHMLPFTLSMAACAWWRYAWEVAIGEGGRQLDAVPHGIPWSSSSGSRPVVEVGPARPRN
eukprot:CAMPEP_0204038838 /NCGR_PEP_ID=MMETSP0360-20130528/89012_1 /ASSEMBLY_ACC=CAM_ASM_000342 /TAXON_ID=268821 /ORGANISM="Scrippsiella Hangoei, Strain SHTV-5" /LENGTH=118 /DNA_ID=CAMNT_0050984615 /DNA_START=1 /DNA_END=354 /DNA_ORIENTATION=-